MYLAGWISCPHCLFKWQICVEVDAPPAADQRIVLRCPNDGSAHRFPLSCLRTVPECPAGVRPTRLEEDNARTRAKNKGAVRWWQFWRWNSAGRGAAAEPATVQIKSGKRPS
jgi:hypothetical protein